MKRILLLALVCSSFAGRLRGVQPEPAYVPRPKGSITFSHDIAPIVHQKCATCHHPGQAAPFELIAFSDVRKHGDQIVKVTQNRYMPPWLPESGYGDFANERRLTVDEIGLLTQWVSEGAPEGNPRETPIPPQWPGGWMLGKPDLVVKMNKPYSLGPDGRDVYRNFAIHLALDRDRYVRAVEFSPGNQRIVHHGFVKLDETGEVHQLDGRDGQPGFDLMSATLKMPGGQFLGWQPGRLPTAAPDGLAWLLPKSSDLVLELHMNRTGKPELLQSSVALYFSNTPPTNSCFALKLGSFALDFPAGSTNQHVEDSVTLPVDCHVLAVLPHAHYLAKEMQGWATLPDGSRKWMLWIKDWNFNWQGDYRYRQGVSLPKGSKLSLKFTYDNSAQNTRNPNQPPKRVVYGPQTSDEMCELWFQIVAGRKEDYERLVDAARFHKAQLELAGVRKKIERNPNDPAALTELGMMLWASNERKAAWDSIERAVTVDPKFADGHFHKGVLLRLSGAVAESKIEFQTAIRLDPQNAKAYAQLGFAEASLGNADAAEKSFLKALEINPAYTLASESLAELRAALKDRSTPGK